MDNSYLDKNKKAWNEKTPVHISSAFYDIPSFIAGQYYGSCVAIPLPSGSRRALGALLGSTNILITKLQEIKK